MTTDVLIEAQDLQMYFGDIHALDGVNAQIRRGEVVVVIGPSRAPENRLSCAA